jgi:ribonuclease HII
MKKQIRVCGIDEAGRGALAGPLVAAAVILPCSIKQLQSTIPVPIRDGKLLTPKQRAIIYHMLYTRGVFFKTTHISATQINTRGIGYANCEAIRQLIGAIDADHYIVDGKLKLGRIGEKTARTVCVIDADATEPCVMLAGIVAKVTRDMIMAKIHQEFPQYNWQKNAGYGTREHVSVLATQPPCRYHRTQFVTTALTHWQQKLLAE